MQDKGCGCGLQASPPHRALPRTQWDPLMPGWSLAETIQQNQESKDYLGHGFSLDFLMQTWYRQVAIQIKLHFSHSNKLNCSITKDNV